MGSLQRSIRAFCRSWTQAARTELKLEEIARGAARVGVLVLSRRFGQQASLVAGLDYVDAAADVMMDADLQHPPELIPRL